MTVEIGRLDDPGAAIGQPSAVCSAGGLPVIEERLDLIPDRTVLVEQAALYH